jgi:hypothetical protein
MSRLREHLERLRVGSNEDYDRSRVAEYITTHTYLLGLKYSFAGHEFQSVIANDQSQEINVQKPSQMGVTELSARIAVAMTEMFPGFNIAYTMPFKGDAQDLCKTRIFPIIEGSPRLKKAVDPDVYSTEIIKLNESLLYFRGTNGVTQGLSVPLEMVISDEIDRCDPEVLKQFTSRLAHGKYKLRRNFSTPTVKGHGIDAEMQISRQFKNFCKCFHCEYWFYPDYYEHVKVPGFDGSLDEITASNLPGVRYAEAKLLCPACGKEPSLKPQYREWVLQNTDAKFEAAGYFISPFDSAHRTPPLLIRESTKYERESEFRNQALGLTASGGVDALELEDLNHAKTTTNLDSSSAHCMGIDVGVISHICVGRLTLEGTLLLVHRERVALSQLEQRKNELKAKYRVLLSVVDGQPFTDVVARMQRGDKALFGSNFSVTKTAAVYEVKMFDGLEAEGKLPIHQAKIARDRAFDQLLELYKRKEIKIYIQDQAMDEEFDKHWLAIKRVQIVTPLDGLVYEWHKPKSGDDDWAFSTLFLLAACKLRGAAGNLAPVLVPGVSIMSSFRLKS